MNVVNAAIEEVVGTLVGTGRLELVAGTSQAEVVEMILGRLADAPGFSQVGPFLARVLLESDLVEELYAEDHEIVAILSEIVL